MAKIVTISVFIFVSSVSVSLAGTVAYKHRETTLEDLRSIDSYVSSALPVLQDGFFIGTERGPVLVKSDPYPGSKKPKVKPAYYNTLPRLIPAGYEGIATSHFHLGAASGIQPFSFSKNFQVNPTFPVPSVQQVVPTQVVQPAEQYITQPAAEQSQHSHQYYFSQNSQPQHQQFVEHRQQQFAEHRPQQFVEHQPQQFVEHHPQQFAEHQPQQIADHQPQQYVAEAQQSQHFVDQPQQEQFIQQETQPAPQQYNNQFEHHPEQYLVERQVTPQQQFIPDQDISQHPYPLESVQVSARNQFPNSQQPSFQDDNQLREQEPPAPPQTASYQAQLFGEERFQSQRLLPNSAVVASSNFEDTLPEPLRNRFYKSANLATILAQESLPVQGEQIVAEWDTNKITKGKIHALLQGAGLI